MRGYIYLAIIARADITMDIILYNEIIRMLNKYPILVRLWNLRYVDMTRKPILTRMGKGKGKKIGEYRPIQLGEVILEGYVRKDLIMKTLVSLHRENIFLICPLLDFFYYEVSSPTALRKMASELTPYQDND